MLPLPPLNDILEGRLGEGPTLDFKRELAGEGKSSKLDIVDDVVSFLNAEGGNILIGIAEHKSSLPTLAPMTGDFDKEAMRLQDILVDNIRERPNELVVEPIQVEGGFLLCVRIGRNTKKPYCNAASGRYLQRRGRKNEPLFPGDVAALRDVRDRLLAEAKALDEIEHDGDFGFDDGIRLSFSVLPIEHLNPDFPSFEKSRSLFSPKFMACVHGGHRPFERSTDGYAVTSVGGNEKTVFRFEVRDDWVLRSTIVHPIPYQQGAGGPEFGSMESLIFNHLADVSDFLNSEGLLGPFAFRGEISRLHSRAWSKGAFPRAERVSLGRPTMIERFDHVDLASKIVGVIRQASRYS